MSAESRALRAAVREERRALKNAARIARAEAREAARNEYAAKKSADRAVRLMLQTEAVMDAILARAPHLAEKYAPLFQ
jgi:hypothetical protein